MEVGGEMTWSLVYRDYGREELDGHSQKDKTSVRKQRRTPMGEA